jgi:hypothetical protein
VPISTRRRPKRSASRPNPPGADQHSEKKRRAALDRLRHRQAKFAGDARRRKADGQHLHGIGGPDQPEQGEETQLKGTNARGRESGVERQRRAVATFGCIGHWHSPGESVSNP